MRDRNEAIGLRVDGLSFSRARPPYAEKIAPQRKPGSMPTINQGSSIEWSGSTISPISNASGTHHERAPARTHRGSAPDAGQPFLHACLHVRVSRVRSLGLTVICEMVARVGR